MLTLFLVFAVLCPAQAERPVPPRPGVFTAGGEFLHFKSNANFTQGGASQDLLAGTGITQMQGTLTGSFDFTKSFRAFAGLSYVQAEATSTDINNIFGSNQTRSAAGFNEVVLGAQGWLPAGQFAIVPEGVFGYPFWRVDEGSDDPLIGEGAMRLRAGAWGIWRLPVIQPFLYGAYEYRDAGRASLLHYSAGGHLRLRQFWLQGEYRAYTSVTDDGDVNDHNIRDTFITRANGGSYRNYSVNPESAELVAQAGIRFNGFNVYGGYATTMSGKSSADGDTFFAGVVFTGKVNLPKPSPRDELSEEEQFQIEKDRYDESLFNEDKDGKKKIKKRVRKQPSVDKLLHETEKELSE